MTSNFLSNESCIGIKNFLDLNKSYLFDQKSFRFADNQAIKELIYEVVGQNNFSRIAEEL